MRAAWEPHNAMTRQFDAGRVPPGGSLMTQSFHNDNQNDDTRDVIRDHDTVSAAEEGNTVASQASAHHNDTVDDTAQSNGEEIRDIRTSRPCARRTSTLNVGGK